MIRFFKWTKRSQLETEQMRFPNFTSLLGSPLRFHRFQCFKHHPLAWAKLSQFSMEHIFLMFNIITNKSIYVNVGTVTGTVGYVSGTVTFTRND